ncbi:hypothetical protein D5R81_16780 [Parashewanella spongiae]|uniref:Uncharacterized protein n=1 Tax=Parashewanella spongiae TaxID=342950 RepID=A0A3A6TZJ0_9GAMM|nr:hypothetical protein [Parashewanella spongiae]MCL1079689.1 hypothetical protein [Parashewanella spongiae]RJY07043.1 hypothetical protein D5R81_16780 [Parashewanella spongiae]
MQESILHECEPMPKNGCYIEGYQSASDTKRTWQLCVYHEATEEDLEESHYLENVGDQVWQATLEINHCPYCGHELTEMKISTEQPDFSHHDFRSW